MSTAPSLRLPTLLVAATLALPLAPASAAPYPINTCVSRKQADAGTYCKQALRASAQWERDHDGGRRFRKLTQAREALAAAWSDAEARSSAAGAFCADTTLGAGQLTGLVDSAIGAIVADVEVGLDPDVAADGRCAGTLLEAAARKCVRLLAAESDFVRAPGHDPKRVALDAAHARAAESFSAKFAKVRRKGCPTGATAAGLEAQVDDLVSAVVAGTTISPNVPDDRFVTVSPTGTTSYLGKTLAPMCMNGSPYRFFAKRGSVNKLLVYYQGGGACWDQLTCSVPTCDTSVNTGGTDNPNNTPAGFFDLGDPRNPFRDWNIVYVPYCSCDIHFGDAAQDYPLHVEHRGYDNARTAEKWAREHFVTPDQIFVTGSSAGAYGAWFNAPLHELVWPAAAFQVLADAGNGVITNDFLQNEFPHWNFRANIPSTIPGVLESLDSGTGIVGYTEAVTAFFPDTRWAHYTTAFDGGSRGQTGFYNIMLHDNDPLAALTWWEGSCAFDAKMREQAHETAAAVPSNYRFYIGTGSRHTMWFENKVYTDTTGGVPTLVDWVGAMVDGTPAWTNVECTDCGLLLPGDPRPPTIPTPPFFQVGSNVKVICDGGSPSGAFVETAATE